MKELQNLKDFTTRWASQGNQTVHLVEIVGIKMSLHRAVRKWCNTHQGTDLRHPLCGEKPVVPRATVKAVVTAVRWWACLVGIPRPGQKPRLFTTLEDTR